MLIECAEDMGEMTPQVHHVLSLIDPLAWVKEGVNRHFK